MHPLVALLGFAAAVAVTVAFWSSLQNWLAESIQRLEARSRQTALLAQNALVILDRVVVAGQRTIRATLRLFVRESTVDSTTQTVTRTVRTVEEVRTLRESEIPADLLRKLYERGAATYELKSGQGSGKASKIDNENTKGKAKDRGTYHVVIRSGESEQSDE